MSLPVKAGIWFTICNFAQKGISFICVPLYTRLLPVDEYGLMSVINSFQSIFIIFATFELSLGAYQRGILKYKDDIKLFTDSITILSNIITVSFTIIVIIFKDIIMRASGMSFAVLMLMCLNFLFYTPYNCWLNLKRFEYDYKPAVIVSLIYAFGSGFLPVLALKFCQQTAEVEVSATLIYGIAISLPFWIKTIHPRYVITKKTEVKEQIIYALKFQSPLIFHSLSYYVLEQSDKLMIKYFRNSSDVAFYSVAYSLAYVIIIFQNSLNQVLKPWRYQKLEVKKYKEIEDISNLMIILVGGVVIVFALIIPDVFKIIFDPKYYEAINAMPPITLSVYFLFLYTIFVDIESYYGETKYVGYVTSIAALTNIILNYVGLQFFNYYICAYTTLASYIIMSFLHYIFMKKVCRNKQLTESPINAKFILLSSTAMVMIFAFIASIYNNMLIRYLLLLGIVIYSFVRKNKIIAAWKTINKNS